jgi:membrane protein
VLRQLTEESRILDAGVYDERGDLIARSGESIDVRDRLALDGKKAGGYFNQQIVEPIQGKSSPLGYLRLTLDTHTLATEAKQVDNTTNILRLMLLLSLAIGVVLTRTLLQGSAPAGNSPLPAYRQQAGAGRGRERKESNLPDTDFTLQAR